MSTNNGKQRETNENNKIAITISRYLNESLFITIISLARNEFDTIFAKKWIGNSKEKFVSLTSFYLKIYEDESTNPNDRKLKDLSKQSFNNSQ